jgi:phenylacetate-CoA ligase
LLALLASYIVDSKSSLGYPVQWVTVGAENLLAQQAELLTRAFAVRPIQHYGMAEAVANFSECDRGNLHTDEDFAAVELVPIGGTATCAVVGTNFTNPAMPLLRYEVGDTAVRATEMCPCGRPGRVIARVDGRLEDYVILRNGARLGRLDHVFKDLIRIREAQIHQQRAGEIIVRVVRGSGYDASDEGALLAELRKRVGTDTDIALEYVESIGRSATGKLRFVVSELREGQLTTDLATQPPRTSATSLTTPPPSQVRAD